MRIVRFKRFPWAPSSLPAKPPTTGRPRPRTAMKRRSPLYGEHLADVFLAAYEEARGTELRDSALWDLWTLARSHGSVETWVPNYRDLGRHDLTAAELRRRHTAWTRELLSRPR